jgi:hypothetical protein
MLGRPEWIPEVLMTRSPRRSSAAIALILACGFAASTCGGPALPALTDPVEIVTAGLTATETARTVHLDITVDGEISADLSGGTGTATTFPLNGTTASADVDMAGGKAHATFAVPALLNLSGELIQIGGTSYVKTSLGGPMFEVQEAVDSLPVDPTDASGIVDDIGDFLLADGVDPVKGDDVECGGKQCYTVLVELTADELAALGMSAPAAPELESLPVDLGDLSLALTIRVEKDTYRFAGAATVVSLGEFGSLTIDVTASKWDEPMDISPPPADQIQPAT